MDFLKGNAEIGVRKIEKQDDAPAPVADGAAEYKLQVNGKSVRVQIDGNIATVNGTAYTVDVEDAVSTQESTPANAEPVSAQMPGKVIRILKQTGDQVQAGEAILILEAMKMEVQITSPNAGTVIEMPVNVGDQVSNGQTLAMVG